MKDSCLLWEKGKTLGENRGFHLHRECPVSAVCSGEVCIYISEANEFPQVPTGQDRFIERLRRSDAVRTRIRLNEIRQQLKNQRNNEG